MQVNIFSYIMASAIWIHPYTLLLNFYSASNNTREYNVFSDPTIIFSFCTNKTDRHEILVTEILLKVALNTINQPIIYIKKDDYYVKWLTT